MTDNINKADLSILIDHEMEKAKIEEEQKRLIGHLKALVNNRDPLKSLIDYLEVAKLNQPTIILDYQCQIQYISHGACRLLDYKRVEGVNLLHKPYTHLISDPEEKKNFETKIINKEPFVQKILLKKKSGLVRVESKVTNYLTIREHLAGVVIELKKSRLFF